MVFVISRMIRSGILLAFFVILVSHIITSIYILQTNVAKAITNIYFDFSNKLQQ
jgi:uncharacterized membrane protein (DUF485 family)